MDGDPDRAKQDTKFSARANIAEARTCEAFDKWISSATLAVLLIAMGCATTPPALGTAEWMNYEAARKLERDCLTYYLHREPTLLYPDPLMICKHVRELQLRGRRPSIDSWQL